MTAYLSIGDFSRASHLTVKTLRHYHRIGLLAPAAVDPHTGYRRYTTDQLAVAQVVRRFRRLDMPLEEIQAVLATPDPYTRNERIVAHLDRLQEQLGRTQRAVDELRDLLAPGTSGDDAVELRSVPEVSGAGITEIVAAADSAAWLQGALGELHATVAAQRMTATGPAGGIYADEVFTEHRGTATVFVPCAEAVHPVGRVRPVTVPAAELAIGVHRGAPDGADRAYAALAGYVARHTLGIPGPIREYYLVGLRDTADTAKWRTEIGWPVFLTGVDGR
ncbi:MerR family transcriptional regulator [Nocardia sp. alder85J]|uniref:MerR family transcriptional regulator n=1 Tax=Nocardia sp. alder85J TaxID=2862949 RepID=UPI001CD1EFE7|nr:MerR family transcriptional regulator [Nocardia sp. alder85J]MCX4099050.1 MerR family transcriptional regulator [Nocardia sp. alder85J]